jgi:hypothetical protein
MLSYSSFPKNFVKAISVSLGGVTLVSTLAFANEASAALKVNGYELSPKQEQWVRFVPRWVIPRLPGDRNTKIDKAATVAWWALKEGIYSLDNAIAYSNCQGRGYLNPLDTCPEGRAWQVGVAGIQATSSSVEELEKLTQQLFGEPVNNVLSRVAESAGYPIGSPTNQAIGNSTGRLRRSWLFRIHAVGFEKQFPAVKRECIDSSKSWCYGKSHTWSDGKHFASNRDAAMRSISDIKAIFQALVP